MLLTPQVLEDLERQFSLAGLGQLAEYLRARCLEPLWTAGNDNELELREVSAASALIGSSIQLVLTLAASGANPGDFLAEGARSLEQELPGVVRRLAAEADIYCARSFEWASRLVVDASFSLVSAWASLDLSAAPPPPPPATPIELPEVMWSDPLFRGITLCQTYVVAVAAAADRPAQLPPMTTAMCSRAHHYAAAYLELGALVDPRATGLQRPRYRPFRHPAFRQAEQTELEQRLQGPGGDDLRARLLAALQRKPDVLA
jgi:hypothetical protein